MISGEHRFRAFEDRSAYSSPLQPFVPQHLVRPLAPAGVGLNSTRFDCSQASVLSQAVYHPYFSTVLHHMAMEPEKREKVLKTLAEAVAKDINCPLSQDEPKKRGRNSYDDNEEDWGSSEGNPSSSSSSSSSSIRSSSSSSCVPSFVPSPPPSLSEEPLSPESSLDTSPPSSPDQSLVGKNGQKKTSRNGRRSKKQKKEELDLQENDQEEDNSSSKEQKEAEENDEDSLGLKPTDKSLDLSSSSHRTETFFGKNLTVLHLPSLGDFLIGREVATLLRRQTFNMYRSMKLRGIGLLRAIPEHVEYFAMVGVVKVGTHSVTLVPHEEGSVFIKECKLREIRLEKKKKKVKKSGLLELYLIANEFLGTNEDAVEKETERE